MSPWSRGADDIRLSTAESVAQADPASACTLAYDPDYPDEPIERAEADKAVASAEQLIEAAAKLLPHLGFLGP